MPKPGPKLFIDAITELVAERKSRPVPSMHRTSINDENIYTAKKLHTALTTSGRTRRWSSFSGMTAFGCRSCLSSLNPCLKMSRIRMAFMLPPVEPAHAPITLNINKKIGRNEGHEAKLSLAKPVVVVIETV